MKPSENTLQSPLVEGEGQSSEPKYAKQSRPSATIASENRMSDEDLSSTWERDLADDYDFCIVFPATDGEFSEKGKGYLKNLKKLGFQLFAYKGIQPDKEIIVLVRSTLEKLRAYGDNVDFVLKLDSDEVQKRMEAGNPEENIKPVFVDDRRDVTPYGPFEHIYGKFSRQTDEAIYWREDGEENPFRELVRMKLNALILEARMADGSQNLKIRRYIRKGWLKACFPLHNRAKTQKLDIEWAKYPWQRLPLYHMKEYFGEKITMYFCFMEHFVTFLTLPAAVGLPLQIAVWATNDYSAPFLPFFSFAIALWAVCALEFWKRREKTIALEWGTIDFEATEVDRPDFNGSWITSFVDGSRIRYFSSAIRAKRVWLSISAILALILVVVGIVVSIYVIRFTIAGDVGDSNAQSIASLANAVQIQVLNYIYTLIANELSQYENHRTDTQFEDSMITKIFMFQFVNSYASFFYLAFIADSMGECGDEGCMSVLAINLAIIFGSRLVTGNLLELLIPYLSYQFRYKRQIKQSEGTITRPEKEYLLEPYDAMTSSLSDYAEVAVGFGYTALFVSALPLAALFQLVSNVVEIRGDGWKLLNLHQRPFPKGCEDIGSWQTIFLLISVAAVVTNAGLAVFTMTVLDKYSIELRFWTFILFQWVCFGLQMIIMEAIPDVPEEIDIQQQRQAFFVRKLIDKVHDDDDAVADELCKEPVICQEYPRSGGAYKEGTVTTNALMENMK